MQILKGTVLLALVLTSVSVYAAAPKSQSELARDPNYLTISTVEMQDLTSQYPQNSRSTEALEMASGGANLPGDIFSKLGGMTGTPLDRADLIVDKVINIGQKIWNVIEKGRPVQNFTGAKANALPQGAARWEQLTNWQRPVSKVYGISYKNLYGIEVVKFVYRVVMLYGGSVNGTGRYIGYASVEPVEINTAFMYTFNASASVGSVYNMGSKASPLAGMILNVNWSVETVLKKSTNSDTFTLDGTGNIRAPDSAR